MSPRATHQDPDIFSSPGRFLPNRWLGPDWQELENYLMVFGHGTHKCLGSRFVLCVFVVPVDRLLTVSQSGPDGYTVPARKIILGVRIRSFEGPGAGWVLGNIPSSLSQRTRGHGAYFVNMRSKLCRWGWCATSIYVLRPGSAQQAPKEQCECNFGVEMTITGTPSRR